MADVYENLPDDEYMVRLSSSCDAVSIFCTNMNSSAQLSRAMEYLTLPAGANENFAMYYRPRLQNYATCNGPEIATPAETMAYWGQSWYVYCSFVPFWHPTSSENDLIETRTTLYCSLRLASISQLSMRYSTSCIRSLNRGAVLKSKKGGYAVEI